MNQIHAQLKLQRLNCRLTQRELAERSGVAYGSLRRLESTGQGSLRDYFQLQTVFDQVLQPESSETTIVNVLPPQSMQPSAQRVRKKRVPITAIVLSKVVRETQSLPLSKKVALDFPYDWSNPNISEEALIAKVLDKARFMDVSRVFAHFGHERVKAVAQDFSIDLAHGVLGALMPGIERGAQYA